jgi:hypothetical protein
MYICTWQLLDSEWGNMCCEYVCPCECAYMYTCMYVHGSCWTLNGVTCAVSMCVHVSVHICIHVYMYTVIGNMSREYACLCECAYMYTCIYVHGNWEHVP